MQSGEKNISLRIINFAQGEKMQQVFSNPGSGRHNKQLSRNDDPVCGKLTTNNAGEAGATKSPRQELLNQWDQNFAMMAEYLRRTHNIIDEKLPAPSEDKFIAERIYSATLMKADSTKNEILFLKIWDPEDLKIAPKPEKNSFVEWNNIIFEHNEADMAGSRKTKDDTNLANSSILNKSIISRPQGNRSIASRINTDSYKEKLRKVSAFKEALFNTDVRVIIGYRTTIIVVITFVIFCLTIVLIYQLINYILYKNQEYEITENLLCLWESAWKILTGVMTVQKYINTNPGLLPETITTENSLLVG